MIFLMSPEAISNIWNRVLTPGLDDLDPAAARALLGMKFSRGDSKRIGALSKRAQRGALNENEAYELDVYLHLSSMLTIMHSKARVALRRPAGSTRLRRKSA